MPKEQRKEFPKQLIEMFPKKLLMKKSRAIVEQTHQVSKKFFEQLGEEILKNTKHT